MLSYVRSITDMKFVRDSQLYFLKLYGNIAITLPVKMTIYFFLC